MSIKSKDWRIRWLSWADRWGRSTQDAGLAGIVDSLAESMKPLAPLAAQLLWVAQPTFALFTEAEAIGALAELLEHPGTAPDLREASTASSESDQ